METKNKEAFKAAFRELVERYIRQFTFYFWFNILINVIIIAFLTALVVMGVAAFSAGAPELFDFAWPVAVLLVSISYITLESFFKNMHILHELRSIDFGVDMRHYEWDHAVHFILDLPMKIEDVERMKAALSFGKIIRLLDLFEMITFEGETCHLDRVFRHKIEKIMERDGVLVE